MEMNLLSSYKMSTSVIRHNVRNIQQQRSTKYPLGNISTSQQLLYTAMPRLQASSLSVFQYFSISLFQAYNHPVIQSSNQPSRNQTADIRHQTADIRQQTSDIRLETSTSANKQFTIKSEDYNNEL